MSELSRKRQRAGQAPSRNYTTRRRALIRAAAEVFRIKGLSDTSLHDISEAIGVDRASLYYYFGSKEQLFRAVILESTEEVVAYARAISTGPGTARERLTALITHIVSSFDRHYPSLHIFVQEDMRRVRSRDDARADAEFRRLAELADLYMSTLDDIIRDGIEACEFRDVGGSYATALVIQGSLNWMHRWLNPSDEQAVASVAELFVTILLDGLAETAPAVSGEVVGGIGRQADASSYPSSMRLDRRQDRG
jgi:TetR/AcrR family transcriptional regulator, cholesterol catabolism regulator